MKILAAVLFLSAPAALQAQPVSGTLELVESLSVSAGSQSSLEKARVDSGKPFSSQAVRPGQNPPAGDPVRPPRPTQVNPSHNGGGSNGNHNGHGNNGNHNGHGNNGNGGHVNPPHNPPPHHNPPVYNPPYNPGYNPYHPGYYNPYHPGYHNPYYPGYYHGPSHETTTPVVTEPMDARTAAIVIGVVVAVVLLLLLI